MTEIHKFCETLPQWEQFRKRDQIERSSSSVPDNIAEGYTAYYYNDKTKSMFVARKEAGETQNHIAALLAKNYLNSDKATDWINRYERVIAGINSFINYIRDKRAQTDRKGRGKDPDSRITGSPSPGFPDFRITCLALFACLTTLGFTYQSSVWQKVGSGIYEPAVVRMAVHPQNPSVTFAATDRALYRSSDGGKQYQSVFQAPGELEGINDIYIDPRADNIYVAADTGLYFGPAAGKNWQRSFYSSDERSRKCLAILRVEETLYLGTGGGLFYKPARENTWVPVGNELSRKAVNHIASGGRFIYFATDDAVYDLDRKTSGYSRIFTAGIAPAAAVDESGVVSESEGEAARPLVRFVRVAQDDDTTIYVATARGIYLSGDRGAHWRLLANPPVGLETLNAFIILGEEEDQRLLVGTKGGAFLFDDGRWTPMYQGMETNRVNDLVKDARGRVYAATDAGVFYLSTGQALSSASANFFTQTQNPHRFDLFPPSGNKSGGDTDPTIQQVHRWAIAYAEVDPQKIKSWRSLARSRAFLPQLSVGLDRGDGEVFHWDTGTNPDTLLKGRDLLSWDVSLSWNLGDVVWSTDQTTIDSRSKLMVELREDVLDQVTRLYFERRRLQVELAADALEPPAQFDKELRVEELTALLDAFTGGKFSRRSSDISRQSSDVGYQSEIWKSRSSEN
ncbi:MAG: four helix bundle protein [Candidatus Omnitrophica bacterium]|nr:four helix bundle protein [Candidatus Omnitrophota bacterium]